MSEEVREKEGAGEGVQWWSVEVHRAAVRGLRPAGVGQCDRISQAPVSMAGSVNVCVCVCVCAGQADRQAGSVYSRTGSRTAACHQHSEDKREQQCILHSLPILPLTRPPARPPALHQWQTPSPGEIGGGKWVCGGGEG